MSIKIRRATPLSPEEQADLDRRIIETAERIKNISSEVLSQGDVDSEEYAPPERSYWPYIKAALDKGDDEFDKVVDSIFDGSFEFPPETAEELEARMKRRRKVCFKY
jgi:hypothetical protein